MIPLESSRLFSALSAADLQELKQASELRSYAPGETVFKEGDHGDGLYFVLSGAIQISALVSEAERRVLSRIQPGDFFGEMAVVDNEPRSATASAETATELLFIPSAVVLNTLRGSPRLAVSLVREFSHRMREFNRHYIQEVLQAERLTLVGRFARSIVHDFKNPLNIIGISAEMAAMETATPSMREAAKSRIRKQVDRLSNMINELLEFTRGSQVSAVLAATNFAAYLNPLLEDLRAEAALKSVEIACENPVPDCSVLIDPARLNHVFYNLVHNAVDALTPGGGKITFRFAVTDNHLMTEVEDSGRGIAPEIAPRLFQAFATYGKAQGTGLGLSICKRIVEDHGGQIHARSEPGRGAVFVITLPLR